MAVPDLAPVIKATIFEDTSCPVLARLKVESNGDLADIQQSDVSTIAYKVFDGDTEVSNGTFDKATTIFNALQTGTKWGVDAIGYNFDAKIPAAAFANGARRYDVEIMVNLASGEPIPIVCEVTVLPLKGS